MLPHLHFSCLLQSALENLIETNEIQKKNYQQNIHVGRFQFFIEQVNKDTGTDYTWKYTSYIPSP